MNLQENIQRIKEVMGLVKERIEDLPQDSYLTMNIKNIPNFKSELKDILKPKLDASGGDFVKFRNSVVKGLSKWKTPILYDDIPRTRYLDYMEGFPIKKFNSLLYSVFSDYFGNQVDTTRNQVKSVKIDCDPTNFEIIGPIVAKDNKSLLNYWVHQEGSMVYRIKLPDECRKQLKGDTRIYTTVEPVENRIHFPKGVPEELRGKGLGTLIYLAMIQKLGYITSSYGSSPEIKMVWTDILTNPKYQDKVMSLILQKQILVFDVNTSLDVKKIFEDFVNSRYTDKKSVRISPKLKEILGDTFDNWYNNLEDESDSSIEQKIKDNEGLEPKAGDVVYDTLTKKTYDLHGIHNGEIQMGDEKYKNIQIPEEEIGRLKVVFRKK